METNDELSETLDEDFDDMKWFDKQFYEAISPRLKMFLREYYGDNMDKLEPQTYLDIDTTIKEDLGNVANCFSEVFYHYGIIKDNEALEHSLKHFVRDNRVFQWPVTKDWFDRDFNYDDDEDTFLEDSSPFDLTEDQRKAKEIVEIADSILDNTRNFAHFMKTGYQYLNKEVHLFLEQEAIFDLYNLSDEGFIALQNRINTIVTVALENLYPLE